MTDRFTKLKSKFSGFAEGTTEGLINFWGLDGICARHEIGGFYRYTQSPEITAGEIELNRKITGPFRESSSALGPTFGMRMGGFGSLWIEYHLRPPKGAVAPLENGLGQF